MLASSYCGCYIFQAKECSNKACNVVAAGSTRQNCGKSALDAGSQQHPMASGAPPGQLDPAFDLEDGPVKGILAATLIAASPAAKHVLSLLFYWHA